MAKSFKKVIACLLAVLMVCFSMPFTALAAPGDYAPDVQLQFGTFYDTNSGSWTDIGTAAAGSSFDYCGIYDAKVDYNSTKNADGSISGNLVLTKANADQSAAILGCDSIDADYAYGVGDYFTVTALFTNMNAKVAVIQSVLTYSDNIEPAGLYSYKSGRNTKYAFGTESERVAAGGTWTSAGTSPIWAQGQTALYNGGFGETADDTSYVNTENNYINVACVSAIGGTDVSSTSSPDPDVPFTNPETGDMTEGYTYTNTVVAETFAFKIVGEGDITFGVWDTDNSKHSEGNYSGGYYFSPDESGVTDTYTTYATNANPSAPGSMKMTIFGMNVNSGQGIGSEHDHSANTTVINQKTATCAEDGYTGDVVCAEHNDVVITKGEVISKDTVAHTYTKQVVDPTHTEKGYTEYTCSVCGHTYKDTYVDALGHNPDTPVKENEVAATCTKKGSYESVVYCKDDGAEISRTTVETDMIPHTASDAVEENRVEPTEEKEGSVDKVVYCSVCGAEMSRTEEVLPKLTHTHVWTDEVVAPTCTEKGYTVHTCACGETYTDSETDALGHDFTVLESAEVPATKETAGKTAVYSCANGCGETEGGEVIPALGVKVTVDGKYAQYGDVNVDYGTTKYDYLSTVTLTATPVEGSSFVGWEISGKKVSEDATLTFTATSDVTVTPIFADTDSAITVVFLDKYNNVAYSYVGDVAGFAEAMNTAIPVGTDYPGFTFEGWSLTNEEIKAITTSTTVTSTYTATGDLYNVTIDGEGTIDGEAVTSKQVTYDTKVTVKSEGATAWEVNGAPVAYGDTYSFFVGSDVTVKPVTGTVITKPEVGMVSATVTDTAKKKVNYLATMSVPETGYTLLDHGFVYVADQVDADVLTVDSVGNKAPNGKAVKKVTAGATGSKQFALNYSVTTAQYATVLAYIVYQAEDGTVTTEYSAPMVFDYNTIA